MPKGCPTPINNPCQAYVDTKCIVYTGADLACLRVRTNDRLDAILRRIDAIICTGGGGGGGGTISNTCVDIPTVHPTIITLTVPTGLSIIVGEIMTVIHDSTHYFVAEVVSYNSSTGQLVLSSISNVGTGNFCQWQVNISGAFSILTEDTNTIDLSGDGSIAAPLRADLIISQAPCNALIAFNDGVFVKNLAPTSIVEGGEVVWIGPGYDYEVEPGKVFVDCDYCSWLLPVPVSLAAADPTYNRYDVIYVDNTCTIGVITGTPGDPTIVPSVDPNTQLVLAIILVAAGTTFPPIDEIIYEENVEWTTAVSGGTINPASATTPCNGTVSVEATATPTGEYITFTNGASIVPSNYTDLKLTIKPKNNWSSSGLKALLLSWENGGVPVGNVVQLNTGTFGFDAFTLICQNLSIPISYFGLTALDQADRLRVVAYITDSTTFGWFLDDIYLTTTPFIPPTPIPLFFRNWLTRTGNIVEAGGTLLHNTFFDTAYNKAFFQGATIQDYPYQFGQRQGWGNSSGIASFTNKSDTTVRLGVNYAEHPWRTDGQGGFVPGPMGIGVSDGTSNGRKGFWIGANGTYAIGQPQGKLIVERIQDKTTGIFFHTSDTTVTDGVTLYAIEQQGGSGPGIAAENLFNRRFLVGHTTGQLELPKYGIGTFLDVSPAYILGETSTGRVVEVPLGASISGYSGYSGKSGYSGYSGSGISGYSAYSGYSGYSGGSGYSGYGASGYSGYSGFSAYSGKSGYSGYSSYSGTSGYSGYSGGIGISGYSGYSSFSGFSGRSGYSGYSGKSGYSGYTGYSGYSGQSVPNYFSIFNSTTDWGAPSGGKYCQSFIHNLNSFNLVVEVWDITGTPIQVFPEEIEETSADILTICVSEVPDNRFAGRVVINGSAASGYSGYSGKGDSGYSGYSSQSGYSGYSSQSGYSGYSGVSGFSGYKGDTGPGGGDSGFSGYSSQSGFSGYSSNSGYSGYSSQSGYSGYSSDSGYSGYSGLSGYSAYSGQSGYSSYSGFSGYSGISGYSAYSGQSGYSGYSGLGISGFSGYSGLSGYSAYSGNSGYSGYSSYSGFSGYSSSSGYSGYSGQSGYSAYSGLSGYSAYSGNSGYSGYSGTGISGFSGYSGQDGAAASSGFSGYSGGTGSDGVSGFSGYSGKSGYSAYSGFSGYSSQSGFSGYSSSSGYSGYSGISGYSAYSGQSGYSGYSGISGYSAYSGISGYSAYSGISGYSAYSGVSGYSAYSGFSGYSGPSGFSGYSSASGYSGYSSGSGYSGYSGISGYSAYSGFSGYSSSSGFSGYSGPSGYSGYSGPSGFSGYSGTSGYSGYSGPSGFSGYSGPSGYSGYSGISGYSAYSGVSGYSGYSGTSGYSAYSGFSGYSGPSGYSGYSGPSGFSGYSGISGYSAYSGVSGYSAYSGISGYSGYSGISGFSGYSGPSGYSGYSSSSGFSGYSGPSGYSAYSGISGYSAYSGISGYSAYSGISGYSGYSGKSGFSGYSGYAAIAYSTTFNATTDWGVASAGYYSQAFTHNLNSNNLVVELWDTTSTPVQIFVETIEQTSTNITTIRVPETPDGRFAGRIVINGSAASGFSGYSSSSGYSGYSAASPGPSGYSGYSANSGYSGYSAASPGPSGYSGYSGNSGYSGYSGAGVSGFSGYSGYSGISGFSGYSGVGVSGYSGYIGTSGYSGYIGTSGYSGYSAASPGPSGYSGYSGISGFSGYSATSGYSGYGTIGADGASGYSGYSGISGYSGYSGTGLSGFSGYSGKSGYSGYSGPSLLLNTTQTDTDYTLALTDAETKVIMSSSSAHNLTVPTNASVAFDIGTQIVIWQGGTGAVTIVAAGGVTINAQSLVTAGINSCLVLVKDATNTWSVASGISGFSGYSGNSGYSGYSGTAGGAGSSGFSGYSGISGYSGYSGNSGYSGYSAVSGYSGYSGISGYSGYSGVPKSTAGVATSPTASQTDSITHSLGKTPVIIRIYGIGTFTSNNSATPTTMSIGIWNSSGNRCIYQPYNTAAITTTQASATSTTFAIRLDTAANSFITGVIQNVGATTFDIAWTETGTASAQNYMWEAE